MNKSTILEPFKTLIARIFSNKPRLIAILLLILLNAFLGATASPAIVVGIVVLTVSILGIYLLTQHFELGFPGIVLVSFLGRWNIGTGTNVAFNPTIFFLAALFVLWLMEMFLLKRDVRLAPSRINLPAFLFMGSLVISFISGNIPWILQATLHATVLAQLGGLMIYVFSIGAMLLVGNTIHNDKWLKIIVVCFLSFGFVFIAMQIIPGLAPPSRMIFVQGTDLGSTFWIWILVFSSGLLLRLSKLAVKWRILLFLLIIGILYTRWFQDGNKEWVSGWGPPIVSLIILVWLRNWKLGSMVSFFAAIGFLALYSDLFSEVMTSTQDYSISSRAATWPILFDLFKANPILGLGPANYYFYTPLFSIFGWYVKFNSHNNYIDILMQSGIFGFITFCWLIFEIVRLAVQLRKHAQTEFILAYIEISLAGLVGMLVSGFLGDWFLPFIYNVSTPGFRFSIFNWIFLGGVLALEQIENNLDREGHVPTSVNSIVPN